MSNTTGIFEQHRSNYQEDIMPVISPFILGWTIGLIEGEGSFSRNTTFRIKVSQKDKWILEQLKEYFGGGIALSSRVYEWNISGGKARGLARVIYPHLSPRRQIQLKRAFPEC